LNYVTFFTKRQRTWWAFSALERLRCSKSII